MKEDSETVRNAIIDSFIDEFNRHGTALKLDDVAKSIHISKKTIYRHFESKDDIYLAIIKRSLDDMVKQCDAIMESSSNLVEKVNGILSIDSLYETRLDHDRVIEFVHNEPNILSVVEERGKTQCRYVKSLLLEAKGQGKLKESVNIDLILSLVSPLAESLYKGELYANTSLSRKEAIHAIVDYLICGIKK